MLINDFKITTIPTGRWRENCYLVHHVPTANLMLIDPGDNADQILAAIDIEGGQLSLILLTHAHHDHVGALKPICEKFNLHFFIHPLDVKLLRRAPMYAMTFENKIIEISTNYKLLAATELEWAGCLVKVIHVPGHTAGGLCYSFCGIAFTGDTLLNRMVGRTDLPGASVDELSTSINRILSQVPTGAVLFPGHGKPWTIGEACEWWELNKYSIPEYREESAIT
jgi:hydroxyacylglutathione hydrolase